MFQQYLLLKLEFLFLQGTFRGRWIVTVKSYRSIPVQNGGAEAHFLTDRTMCAVTMNENAFVLLDDPVAPTKAESLAAVAENPRSAGQQPSDDKDVYPPHYRTSYITLNPPQSLELLLTQLRARWQSVRQPAGQNRVQNSLGTTGVQLSVEGKVFAIGTDWLVRAGNVVLAGGTVRGMLLEVCGLNKFINHPYMTEVSRLNICLFKLCLCSLQTGHQSFCLIFSPLSYLVFQMHKLSP
jgi:hypothetical protein